jgi:hypothetical protein
MSYSGYLYHGEISFPMLAALESTAVGTDSWVSTLVTAISKLTKYRGGRASGRMLPAILANNERPPA